MDSNKSKITSSGENIVEEVNRLFLENDFVRGVQISNPIHVLITTRGYDRCRRKALYSIAQALRDKYPNVLFDFHIRGR